jgi:putative PIN family toxin of toxin-antitoxin system
VRPSSKPQIVIDTNVVAAAMKSSLGASSLLLSLLVTDSFDLHLSVPVLLQYEDVLKREALKLPVTVAQVKEFLETICDLGFLHEIYYLWRPTLIDPGDDSLLELAVAAQAQWIVTHNARHFRGCEAFGVEAVGPLQFMRILGAL